MAAIIKFPLKMADGAQVKTIEELREHFDLEAIIRYYDDGRLGKWLRAWYYDNEAEKVERLDSHSGDLKKGLCDILGVPYLDSGFDKLSLGDVLRKNERLGRLKQFTADDRILASIERVAFTQEELERLLDEGCREIYLCGERFTIPGNIGGVKYTGINEAEAELVGMIAETDITFQNLKVNIDKYTDFNGDKPKLFFRCFDKNRPLGIRLLCRAVEKGSVSAQVVLGKCYANGFGVWEDYEEAVRWYRKAAEQGNANAQTNLGHCYRYGIGVQKNEQEAVRWSRKAAEQGNANAQTRLGICYQWGVGVQENEQEAVRWYQKAAEQGNALSQYYLGCCYRDGLGVEKKVEKAIEWFQKSAVQGCQEAELALAIAPGLPKWSDVILYAIGNDRIENLVTATLDKAVGKINILVEDRYNVNINILKSFGAKSVRMEPKYYTGENLDSDLVFNAFQNLPEGMVSKDWVCAYFMGEKKIELVKEDLGGGWLHIQYDRISPDMEEDFECNVKPFCMGISRKEASRDTELELMMKGKIHNGRK